MSSKFKYHFRCRGLKLRRLKNYWIKFWSKVARIRIFENLAIRMTSIFIPPHKAGSPYSRWFSKGYISPSALIYHSKLWFGKHVFVGEGVTILDKANGGNGIEIGDLVRIYKDTIIETGYGGSLKIESGVSIHPRCQINAFIAPIFIGKEVMIAPNCSLYSYDHGFSPDKPISEQALRSKGPIIIEEESWLGVGATILSGVRIGKGAVVSAGSIVTKDVPNGAIVAGNPATIIKMRSDLIE